MSVTVAMGVKEDPELEEIIVKDEFEEQDLLRGEGKSLSVLSHKTYCTV